MIHPIPSGTRDVLPDETRELRAITDALRAVFERHGYGEVYTPALEYESVLARAGMAGSRARAPGVRRDRRDAGAALGHDRADRPRRRHALSRRRPSPCGSATSPTATAACARSASQPRELLQAGIELIGSPAPGGTAEALTVLCDALDATGLTDYRVGLGDASLFATLMDRLEVDPRCPSRPAGDARPPRFRRATRSACPRSACPRGRPRCCSALSQRRGGPEVLAVSPGPAADAVAGMRQVSELLAATRRRAGDLRSRAGAQHRLLHGRRLRGIRPGARASRSAAAGATTSCSGASARSRPAVGFALDVERLHIALAGEERGTGAWRAR